MVLIATPDHHHAPAAIRAINLGKATFSQKPLAHNIYECYALAKAAREKKVLTQMGNQGHCGETIRRACEYIWAGAIGNVTETHTHPRAQFRRHRRPARQQACPGAACTGTSGSARPRIREYHDGLHPFSWRSWRQFGTGTIGDMACHNLDALFWALKIAEAKTLHRRMPQHQRRQRGDVPAEQRRPLRGARRAASCGPVKVHVYDHGDLKPEIMKETEKDRETKFGECTLFVGDKGLFRTTGTSGSGGVPAAKEKRNEVPAPDRTLPRAHGGPIEDLFYAIKNGATPCSNFPDAAGPLTAFALTGHLAQFAGVGKKVEWDVEKMKCTNLPEINRHVRRDYRNGWEV